jgi:hypothetical protein
VRHGDCAGFRKIRDCACYAPHPLIGAGRQVELIHSVLEQLEFLVSKFAVFFEQLAFQPGVTPTIAPSLQIPRAKNSPGHIFTGFAAFGTDSEQFLWRSPDFHLDVDSIQ